MVVLGEEGGVVVVEGEGGVERKEFGKDDMKMMEEV